MEIVTFIAGILIGWFIQHVYSVRSSQELRQLFEKLSAETREMILKDPRKNLSVSELNELLEKQTIDSEDEGPLPYKACPKCGSTNLARQAATDPSGDENYYAISCPKCKWSDWTQ